MSPKRFIIPVFIPHLGCHNDCVFCNQRKISGELKPATAKTVKAAVEEALKKIPEDRPAELAFYGATLRQFRNMSRLSFSKPPSRLLSRAG